MKKIKIEELVRPSVRQLAPYVCARDLYKGGKVLLDANENPFPNSIDGSFAKLNRYPDSDSVELRKALAKYCGVGFEKILVGNGSNEMISLAISTFAEKGDKIITLAPGYSMYRVCAKIAGVEVVQVPLTDEFEPDVAQILAAVDEKTKMLMFCSPNSPVGVPVKLEIIEKLLDSFEGIVFIDEAYYEFYGKSVVPLLEKYENLIVCRTLSKAWGLASLRVGYALANEKIIEAMRKIKPPYNVGGLVQSLALSAIENNFAQMTQSVEKIKGERTELSGKLRGLGLAVFPSVTNFVLVKFPQGVDSRKVQGSLAAKGVIVRDCSAFPMLENCIRITVGTAQENEQVVSLLEGELR